MLRMVFVITLIVCSVLTIASGTSVADEGEEILTAREDQMSLDNSEGMLNSASDDVDNEAVMAKRGGKGRYRRW